MSFSIPGLTSQSNADSFASGSETLYSGMTTSAPMIYKGPQTDDEVINAQAFGQSLKIDKSTLIIATLLAVLVLRG